MKQTLIKVQCLDQELHIMNRPIIASGGFGEDLIEFTFCEKWVGFAKTAVFYRDIGMPFFQPLEDDKCIIPWEVLTKDGDMFFGVFGDNADGVRRTSEITKYKVKRGAVTENLQPSDPTPELWAQVLSKIQVMTEAAADLADSAEQLGAQQADFIRDNTITIDPETKHWIKGGQDTGVLARATYVHFRWSMKMPTSDAEMLTRPAPYIGIYNGVSETAPTNYTAYQWFKYVGDDVSVDVLTALLADHEKDQSTHTAAFAAHNNDDEAHRGVLAPFKHSHTLDDMPGLVDAVVDEVAAEVASKGFDSIATGSYIGDGSGTLSLGLSLVSPDSVDSSGDKKYDRYSITYSGDITTDPRRIEFPFAPNIVILFRKGDDMPVGVIYNRHSRHVKAYLTFAVKTTQWNELGDPSYVVEHSGSTKRQWVDGVLTDPVYQELPTSLANIEDNALCLYGKANADISSVSDRYGTPTVYVPDEGAGVIIDGSFTLESVAEMFNEVGVTYYYIAI